MHDMGTNILFRAFCALADGTASVINSSLKHFADEFEARSPGPLRCARIDAPGGGVVSDGVTLTIDGKEVTVPKGTLIIRAAEQLGIEIPRFCDHPLLEPAGAPASATSRSRASRSSRPPAPCRWRRTWS